MSVPPEAEKSNMASDTQSDHFLLILDAIKLHFNTPDLKARINKCSIQDLTSWKDLHGLDLLHHCILEKNVIAFIFIISRGHFKPPYEPSTWPYLHLVSLLGYKGFISTIAQEMKYQNKHISLDWLIFKNIIEAKMIEGNGIKLQEADKLRPLSPVDLAAMFNHIGCVTLLLDFWQVHKSNANLRRKLTTRTSPNYLTLACHVNSPHALRLLLSEYSDKKEALESALKLMTPECVDVVLRDKDTFDSHQAFNGMNLYHVLFSYNSCLSLGQYELMGGMTAVLLKHEQNVNACRPSRTYPLYSLLSHVPFATAFENCEPNLLATLLLLLKAGADPNVDEIIIEEHLKDVEEKTAFGRRPFSSAVNCILKSLPMLKSSRLSDSADEYVYKCIELLLRHGADLSYMGRFDQQCSNSFEDSCTYNFGSSLHTLVCSRVDCLTNYSILRLILHYGADTNVKGLCSLPIIERHISYAVNIIPFFAWLQSNISAAQKCIQVEFCDQDLKNMFYIMKFMSHRSLILAHQEFVYIFDYLSHRMKGEHEDFPFDQDHYIQILKEYERLTHEPWQLQHCCAHTVWQSCRQHMGNVYDLPVPGPLKNIVMNYH